MQNSFFKGRAQKKEEWRHSQSRQGRGEAPGRSSETGGSQSCTGAKVCSITSAERDTILMSNRSAKSLLKGKARNLLGRL